jgi:hypothetical protein
MWTQCAFLVVVSPESEEQLGAQAFDIPAAPPARGTATGQHWDSPDAVVKCSAPGRPAAEPILTTLECTAAGAGRGSRAGAGVVEYEQVGPADGRAEPPEEGQERRVDEHPVLGAQGDADADADTCGCSWTAGWDRVHGLHVGYGRRLGYIGYVLGHSRHRNAS